jgi:hypothetical protein
MSRFRLRNISRLQHAVITIIRSGPKYRAGRSLPTLHTEEVDRTVAGLSR